MGAIGTMRGQCNDVISKGSSRERLRPTTRLSPNTLEGLRNRTILGSLCPGPKSQPISVSVCTEVGVTKPEVESDTDRL
jgi:hypothetical protein